jgi:GAF domain-containing protein/CheY-like chemotaxis protein
MVKPMVTTNETLQNELTLKYADRITRRLAPLLMLVAAIFALTAIIAVFNSVTSAVENAHVTGLERTTASLQTKMAQFTRDARDLASDSRLQNFSIGSRVDALSALQPANTLIRNAEGEYLAIRYLDNEGFVLLETIERGGSPIPTITADTGELVNRQTLNDPGFIALAAGSMNQITLGRFYETLSPNGLSFDPPRASFSVYASIISEGMQQGIIQIEIDATRFLNIVNQSELSLFFLDDLPERRLLLLNNQGVIADSGSGRPAYLQALDAPSGNLIGNPVYAAVSAFDPPITPEGQQVGQTLLEQINGYLLSEQTLNFSGVQPVDWQLFFADSFVSVYAQPTLIAVVQVIFAALIVIASAFLLRRALIPLLRPYAIAERTLMELAEDDYAAPLPTLPATEGQNAAQSPQAATDPLIISAETLVQRISSLSEEVDVQTRKRARDLQIAGRIGREIATLGALDDLLKRAINLICYELNFYHGQVFLVDNLGQYASLRHSRGEAGQRMMEQNHRIEVGSRSVIGAVTGERRPVIVNDTVNEQGGYHAFNPLLPDTRAEMGLPLIVGERIIGALDLQSKQPNVFLMEDIPTFQLIADQLAIAIYNAQLRAQSEQRIAQINRLNRQLSREGWQNIGEDTKRPGMINITPVESDRAPTTSAPISIRGEVIGTLDVATQGRLSSGDQMILSAVAERVSLAIENARLIEQTQISLTETATLYALTRQLNEADTLLDVLQAIVESLAQDANSAQVWVFEEYLPSEDPSLARLQADLPVNTPTGQAMWPAGSILHLPQHPALAALNSDEVLLLSDVAAQAGLGADLRADLARMEAQAIAFVPVSTRSTWRGFLTITFPEVRTLNSREGRIYQALINQAGVAIDNRLLLFEMEDALARNEKLYAGSRIINTMQKLQDLVYAAVATGTNLDADFWLGLLEGEADAGGWPTRSRIVAQSSDGSVQVANLVHDVHVAQNSPLRDGKPEIITLPDDPDAALTPLQRWLQELDLRFMAILPMFGNRAPSALFYIVSKTDVALSDNDYEVYTALTSQMSTQIENVRLLRATEEALSETRRLYVAGRAIANAATLDEIYAAVSGHLALPFMQSDDSSAQISVSVLMATPTPTEDAPELEYAYQWSRNPLREPSYATGEHIDHQAAPFAKLLGNTEENVLVYPNLDADDTLSAYPTLYDVLSQQEALSAAITPLRSSSKWFGVLICRTDQPSLFNDSYIRFMQSISSRIATAIERQQLLRETEAERQRLDAILQTLPTGVLVLSPETLMPVVANESAAQLLGRAIDFAQPFSAAQYSLHESDSDDIFRDDDLPPMLALSQGRTVSRDDITMILPDKRVDLVIGAAPIANRYGEVTAIVTSLQDVSSLRVLENDLQRRLQEQVFYLETQRALAEASDIEQLLDSLMTPLMMQQPNEAYIILNGRRDGDPLSLARYLIEPLENPQILRPLLADATQIISDLPAHPAANDALLTALPEARTIIVTPLIARTEQRVFGWLMGIRADAHAFDDNQERISSSIADMAAAALDNILLTDRTRDQLDEIVALYTATNAISRSRNLQELTAALQTGLKPFAADMYASYFTAQGQQRELINQGFEASITNGLRMERLLRTELPRRDGLYIADITRSTLSPLESEVIRAGNIRAFAAINLRLQGENTGRLFIGFKQPREFSEGETRLLNTIADSASVVIDNQLLVEQTQANLREANVLYNVSREINAVSQVEEIIDIVTEYLAGPHISQVFIAMLNTENWDSPNAAIEIVASWQSEQDVDLRGVALTQEQFPAWRQLASKEVLTINDIYDEHNGLSDIERTSIESLDARSLVVIPLGVPKRAIGTVWLSSREPYNYTESDRRIFQPFAEQTSLSLEAARALDLSNRRARQLVTSAQIGRDIAQIMDLTGLLSRVVNLIQQAFDYDHVQVFLLDATDKDAELVASTGEAGKQLLAVKHSLPVGSASVIGQVTQTGEPSIALDTADANVVHKPNPYLPLTRSELALPLIVKGRIVGALDVQSNQPNAFGEEDLQALETLAAQISVAIDNSALYEDAQRGAEEMRFLFDMTATAAAADSLQDALQIITSELLNEVDAHLAAIYMPRVYADHQENIVVTLRAEALSGTKQPLSELTEIGLDDSENLIAVVANTLSPQIVLQSGYEPRFVPIAQATQSAVVVPIATGGELIGVTVLENERQFAFTQRTVNLLQTLAGSLAAVIQNTLLVEQLQRSNEQLREVDRLKSQFLANMSHELRTPLNSIIGFSRVMLREIDGPLTEMQEQDLTTIHRSGNLLLTLINEILDQAKIESGELNLKFGYFELGPVIETVRSIGIGLVKEKPIDLKSEIAPNLPKAYGDEFRTRQILNNLVGNATKFTPEGEIRIQAFSHTDKNGQQMLRIDVIDTGIGIAVKDLPTIFEQFRQVDSSLTRTAGGTGLGLPLARSLAEMQGGSIEVESEIGRGSKFSFLIPTAPGAEAVFEQRKREEKARREQARRQLSAPQSQGDGAQGNGETDPSAAPAIQAGQIDDNASAETQTVSSKTRETQAIPSLIMQQKRLVLLIEDNRDMVDQFRRTLQREGFEVQTADHAAYARAMVSQLRPTVVIMDVNFEGGQGWDILRDLKDQDDTFDIPIIVSTLNADSETAYRYGAFTYLQRPTLPDKLMQAVLAAEKESQRQRILIIDDQESDIRLLTQILGENGNFRVFSAETGTQGISMVARHRPDLVILDLRMPGMDGFAVLQELRQNPETANIPVLIVTGDADFSNDEEAQLTNVRVLQKTDISREEYDKLISSIQSHLTNGPNEEK